MTHLENTFSKDEYVFLSVSSDDGDLFTANGIGTLAEVTDAGWLGITLSPSSVNAPPSFLPLGKNQ